MNFTQLNLKNELNLALNKLGHVKPTSIQNISIPLILKNKDIFGKSRTGTGKTAAFILPILHNLDTTLFKNQILIVCPTKDLAVQILNEIKKYSMYLKNVKTALLIGGLSMKRQLADLKSSNIVIGTPGRIVDHLNRNTLKLRFLKTIVLDETDEMVKMGFKEQIDEIFASFGDNPVQSIFFSATISKSILNITEAYQNDPVKINLNDELKTQEHKNLKQFYFDARNNSKEKALIALYKELNPKLSIIFSNTKAYTTKIQDLLKENGIDSVIITGDKRQREREQAMKMFKSGQVNVLIATDLMARGIHVDGIDYVFNFDIPKEKEYYIHRIGRTARADSLGTAITIVNNKSFYELKNIEKYQNQVINKLEIDSDLLKFEKSNSSNRSDNYRRQTNSFSKSRLDRSSSYKRNDSFSKSDSYSRKSNSNSFAKSKRTGQRSYSQRYN